MRVMDGLVLRRVFYTALVGSIGLCAGNAAHAAAPGGVTTNLEVWLKPDTLIANSPVMDGAGWTDSSPNANNFAKVVGMPLVTSGSASTGLNYNPYVLFDGASYLSNIGAAFVTDNTATTIFSVAVTTQSPTDYNYHPYDFGSGSRGSHYVWSDYNYYNGVGTNDRLGFRPDTGAIIDVKAGVASITQTGINTYKYHILYTRSATNDWATGFDGLTAASTTTNTTSFALNAGGTEYIGASATNALFKGNVAETIEYNRVLTATERQKVDSYLAVKYGLTLGTTASVVNYLNSAGITIWTGSATYQNRVLGIARDDASALSQKQTGNESIIQMGLGSIAASNADNKAVFGADLSALMFGDDNGAQLYSAYTGTATAYKMARVWKVQKTGTVGAVVLTTSNTQATHVLVPNNATFASGVTEVPFVNGQATVTFTTGQFFTLASTQAPSTAAPGGVTGNLELWLKPDALAANSTLMNGTGWQDSSPKVNNLSGVTGSPQVTSHGHRWA